MRIDLRLAIPAAVAWLVAGIVIGAPALALPMAIPLWIASAALARRLPVVALCAVAAALLATLVAIGAAQRAPALLLEASDSGRHVSATVTVTGSIGGERLEASYGGAPLLLFGDIASDVRIGSTLAVGGTLQATEPGDGTAFLLFADSIRVVGEPPWYLEWANDLRSTFADSAAAFDGNGADLLPGLAIGDTSAVSEQLDSAMKSSSLSHLTAVSGSNCAVVVGLIVLLGRQLGLSRRARIGAALIALLAFVVLVTPQPSVLRAAVMAAIVLGALASGRPVRGLPVMSLAVIVLLASDPWLARDYGFALSVLATGGLILLAPPLAERLARRMPLWLATVIAVPLAAQLCCQPVLILLQPSLPTFGVVANVLAEPAAPAATVLGLAACLTLPIAPWLGHALVALAWLPASWIAAVATFFASLPLGAIAWPGGAPGLGLLAAVTAFAIVAVLAKRRPRLIAAIAGAAVLVLVIGTMAGSRLGVLLDRPTNWQIAMCDVGQGDATLLRSNGVIALIDTGREPALMAACLGDLGITRIDLLILSHYDLDHVGGTSAVFGRVTQALIGPSSGADDDYLVAQLAASGAQITQASKGMAGTLGELRWSVLWPKAHLGGVEPGNDASVAVQFDCSSGCLSSLFLGDLGEHPQQMVQAVSPIDAVDVVKVAHHGSADQSAATYEHAAAAVGLIGVGADNTYGHPTDELLNILASVGTTALRTDLDGMILLSPGAAPHELSVWTSRDGPPG
jgi:competence protein ComEC